MLFVLMLLIFTEVFHFQAQQLSRKQSEGDDKERKDKWISLLSTEKTACHEFCSLIESECPGMIVTANSSPIFQECNRIEDLYFMAHASNALFQDVFEFLVSKSDVVPGSLKLCGNVFVKCLESAKEDILKAQLNPGACRLVRGPVKRPDRAIAKVYRAYGGDVSKLTDLVRCSLCDTCRSILLPICRVLPKRFSASAASKTHKNPLLALETSAQQPFIPVAPNHLWTCRI